MPETLCEKPGSAKAPVVLFLYNRPLLTEKVIESIRCYRPERLYAVADGPKADAGVDAALCREARAQLERVDWDCEVISVMRDCNYGSGRSVKEGLDWVFEREERAIILEDDTVPVPSFFSYCQELLEAYQDDSRVGMVAGTNVLGLKFGPESSYFFSLIPHTWGWATWRRAWSQHDSTMGWRGDSQHSLLRKFSINRKHFYYWRWVLDTLDAGKVDTWDWQWYLTLAKERKLTIVPCRNLVENIGFGTDSTHTVNRPKNYTDQLEGIPEGLESPSQVCTNRRFDRQVVKLYLPERRPEYVFWLRALRFLKESFIDKIYLIVRRFFSDWCRVSG